MAIRSLRRTLLQYGGGNHRVGRCYREVLPFGREMIEEVLIAQVKGVQEEHDLENLRDSNQRAREGRRCPLKHE